MLARVLSSSGTILRYPLPHNSGSPVRVAHHLPHNSPKMSICRPHLGCTFVVVLPAQPRIIRVDITYLDNLDFPAPVEEFPVTLAPQFAPDPSTEVTPGFNHRNHLSSLFAQGSSAWLGLALQHPAVPELTQGRVAELFSLLLHRHDALRWAVFLPSSQQPPFFSTPTYTVHALPPQAVDIQPGENCPVEQLESLISQRCSPLGSPGAFCARSGDFLLLCFDHLHVDMISMDILARELYSLLEGGDLSALSAAQPAAYSYAEALQNRDAVERDSWDAELSEEVWGEFFRETSGTIPGFPADLGVEKKETLPAAHETFVLVPESDLREEIAGKPFPHILTAMARVLGKRVPLLIPMHTRGKAGSPAQNTVGWLVGNAPIVAMPEPTPVATRTGLRNAVAAQGLSLEKVLSHYAPEFPHTTIFSASFIDFTKRGGSVPGAHYVSSRSAVDSAILWFSRTECGIAVRACYPDTPQARSFMKGFFAQLSTELGAE